MDGVEKNFLEWLEANGATLDGVCIARFDDGTGRGVAASRDLKKGEYVVKIPESLILIPESGVAAGPMRKMGLGPEEFDSPRLEREGLVLAVLAEQAAGTRSKWAPYLAALPPPHELHCPVLWSDDECAALEGTSVLKMMLDPEDDAQELPNMTEEHWQHVAIPFLEANSRMGFGTTDAGRDAHSYATALVAGYSFSLGKGHVQAMVPFWDILNHANPGEEGVRLNYDEANKSFNMITTRPHKKGEQVFNSYGPIGNGELLRRYGCTTSPNPHDMSFLRVMSDNVVAMALDRMQEHSGEGHHIMHALNLMAEAKLMPAAGLEAWIPVSGEPPPALMEVVRLLTMSEEQLVAFSRALAARGPRRRYHPLRVLKERFEISDEQAKEMGAVLTEIAGEALRNVHKHDLAKAAKKGTRYRLAAEVTMSERRCLEALAAFGSQADAVDFGPGLAGLQVWRPLVARRRRSLPDFVFSPYHRHAHVRLTKSGRPRAGRRSQSSQSIGDQ